ncbi:MAG: hypothetical protein ACJ8F7_17420 [Gemmataceae bacterium]
MNNSAFLIGVHIGGLVAGAVCGSVPLSIAAKRGRIELGVGAMVFCLLCGLILGLLGAIPCGLICTFAIFAMSKPRIVMFHDSETLCGGGPIDWTALDPDAPPPTLPSLEPNNRRRPRPVYERERSAVSLPTTSCTVCGARITKEADSNPWCPRCGTDLKSLTSMALR